MAKSLKGLIIRPSLAFQDFSDDSFNSAVNNVCTGLDGNTGLGTPPVPIADVKSLRDAFSAAMVASAEGSKTATADKNKKREQLTVMMRQLAHYVEVACNGDMAIFLSSGFQPRTITRSTPQPLAVPTTTGLAQGMTGQMLLSVKNQKKALHHDAKVTPVGGANPGLSGQGTMLTVSSLKQPITFNGLTPGTIYSFQVRAYGKLGYTEWSDPVTRMCI
jgi:hypothetical protein